MEPQGQKKKVRRIDFYNNQIDLKKLNNKQLNTMGEEISYHAMMSSVREFMTDSLKFQHEMIEKMKKIDEKQVEVIEKMKKIEERLTLNFEKDTNQVTRDQLLPLATSSSNLTPISLDLYGSPSWFNSMIGKSLSQKIDLKLETCKLESINQSSDNAIAIICKLPISSRYEDILSSEIKETLKGCPSFIFL